MRFAPITEQQADAEASGLWESGTYDYEVKGAEEKVSKAGNDMVVLDIMLFDQHGNTRKVFDYLVSGDRTGWKIRHFAESCGLLAQYESGSLEAADIVGHTGRCQIGTQPAKDAFPAKNVVKDYVKAAQPAARLSPARSSALAPARKPAMAAAGGDLDDEIPF